MFNSDSEFHSLDADSNSPPHMWQPIIFQDTAKCPPGAGIISLVTSGNTYCRKKRVTLLSFVC